MQQATERSLLKEIWSNYNVSTILVLPLFWRISKDISSEMENVKFPFIQLAFEHGLINTFLMRDSVIGNVLHLLFKKQEFIKNLESTNNPSNTLWGLISDSEYFNYMEDVDDYILIGLNIPENFSDDIAKIIEGKYSTVSDDYKREVNLKTKYSHVPKSKNELAKYIVVNDLAYAICIKAVHLKEDLNKALGLEIENSAEFFNIINLENENLVTDDLSLDALLNDELKFSDLI